MPLKKSDLYASIWASCDDLRGGMDASAALEARREKTKALKLGMMQELLTGRTRLVTPARDDVTA